VRRPRQLRVPPELLSGLGDPVVEARLVTADEDRFFLVLVAMAFHVAEHLRLEVEQAPPLDVAFKNRRDFAWREVSF
jgi:hypothetical protein